MALFSKNRPTKRLDFDGAWVELQHLSKGVFDEVQSRYTKLYEGVDRKSLEQWQKTDELPDEIPLDIVAKTNEVEYYKVSHAIHSWSEEESITHDTVKELDSEVFDQILKEVNTMNKFTEDDKKN
jgi:hypothetical protein